MSCEDVRDRLDDYVDGELGEADFQVVELHLAGCADCRREERLLRALLAQAAALPRERTPAKDLWPGIVPRLATAPRVRRFGWASPVALAAAAAVLLAVSAALLTRSGRTPSVPAGADNRASVHRASVTTSQDGLRAAEREYARATAELMQALDRQRTRLTPETVRAIEENLRTIDEALAQVRAALEQDPTDPRLAHLLTATHQKKVDALQRIVRLNRL
jgi:anti-sigma factor RsiW